MLSEYAGSYVETETAWCPDWYALIQAAKYLNVAPWELLKQSIWWQDRAFMAMNAEAKAQKIIRKQQGLE